MLYPEDLLRTGFACVHFAPEDEARAACNAVAQKGSRAFEASGARMSGTDGILPELARAMAFPDYFGENMDALVDCLRDLSWAPAQGYALRVTDAGTLWRKAPQSAGALVSVWLSVAEEWARSGVPFHLVFSW